MVWQMWLPAALFFAALIVVAIAHTFNYQREFFIPADEVARVEGLRTQALAAHV
jgi:cytochrome o ubiquinol oxidase subunit 1